MTERHDVHDQLFDEFRRAGCEEHGFTFGNSSHAKSAGSTTGCDAVRLALSIAILFAEQSPCCRTQQGLLRPPDIKGCDMNVRNKLRLGRATFAAACAILLSSGPGLAQTRVKLSLDSRIEGTAAPFAVAIDKGYFKAEGLDVTIEPAPNRLEPLNRV